MAKAIATLDQALGRAAKLLRVLREAGLSDEVLQHPIDDAEMRNRLVLFWNLGGFEPSTSQKHAREIMGRNFFGIEEAIKHFGANPSKVQIAALSEVPFTEEVLSTCKDTHVLVAVFPMSILDIRGKVERKLFYSHEHARYNEEAPAKDRGEIGWRLVRKTLVPNSTLKKWDEQQLLFSQDEETPSAQVIVYTIIGHYLATGERLFENIYARTSSVVSSGDHVSVGDFDRGGLGIGWWDDSLTDGTLGVFSTRKS